MATVTHDKRVVSRDAIPAKARINIEYEEFKVMARDFADGRYSCGPELLHRMETGMGVSYDYRNVLLIIDTLLRQPNSYEYIDVVKYHLQSLQNKIDEDNRKKHKALLAQVMSLSQKKGIDVKDPSRLTFWTLILGLIALPFVMVYEGFSWLMKVSGKIIVWGIILAITFVAFLILGFKGAIVAFILMGCVFSNRI